MRVAERISRLGTETAFKVSDLAREWEARGNKVYPFHVGDINISTPSHIVEAALRAIKDGKTGYSPSAGIPELREALAEDVSSSRGVEYTPEEVSVQPGGKPVIGKFFQALLNPGDEALYPNPGYPIYESQIEFYGGIAKPYRFVETDRGFDIDFDYLKSLVSPRTRLFVYNNWHNPLGSESTEEEMESLANFILENDLYVLSDEAYFDIRYSGRSKSIVSYPGMKERTIILYTFSKKYAMTGWRLGAAIGPKDLIQIINKLNVNIESCSNHFVQYAGVAALKGPHGEYQKMIDILRERRDIAVEILNSIDGVKVHKPETTFYLFPNVTEAMRNKGIKSLDELVDRAMKEAGVSFCSRSHFGRPFPGETEMYIRLAYSGIDKEDIKEGLTRLKEWFEAQ
ncbi:MAG: aminotransferase class I/II-fold pyridoxal phosphate-dependent enzyme [Candidatus Marinimicrobia bacterium]|nr:aminotransferase class I/II-fold pyridoxal phosphate-dependent enzyme [Candidatus Neomarinimicrobiota bacterium]